METGKITLNISTDEIDEESLKETTAVPSFWKIIKNEFMHEKIALIAAGILAVLLGKF